MGTKDIQQPVAIFGWGQSGRAAAALLSAQNIEFEVFDEGSVGIAVGEFTDEHAAHYKTVVYSPGFPLQHPWLARARAAGTECLAETDLGALYWRGPIIAVTGTNGKTTITRLLHQALEALGTDAAAVGNIGTPMCRLASQAETATQTAVCEVSSFQAEALQHFAPRAVLWSNFAPDHIDRHGNLKNYFAAKWRLVENLKSAEQGAAKTMLVIGESAAAAAKAYGFTLPAGSVILPEASSAPQNTLKRGPFCTGPMKDNYATVAAYWGAMGYPMDVLERVAESFELSEHRMQLMGPPWRSASHGGVSARVQFINDSKATNFHAALGAARAFAGTGPLVWIGGGQSKGGDLATFAQRLGGHIDEAFVIGEVAPQLCAQFDGACVPQRHCTQLTEAVKLAAEAASLRAGPGGKATVLFSPGFASFDAFRSYEHRGESFAAAIQQLPKGKNTPPPGFTRPREGGEGSQRPTPSTHAPFLTYVPLNAKV